MLHTNPSAGFIAFPSPDLIGNNVNEIPTDIELLTNTVNEMMIAAVEEMNCVIIPNKD